MKKICLDYGHGGRDPGAVYGSRKESDDVLKVGKIIKGVLSSKYEIGETRRGNEYVSLRDRAEFSNKNNYDLFLSLHRNAFYPEKAEGLEIFIHRQASKKAVKLAYGIQKALVKLGFKDRGVKRRNFYVLRATKAPAILIELGFIDNTRDNNLFDKKIREIAELISWEIKKTAI